MSHRPTFGVLFCLLLSFVECLRNVPLNEEKEDIIGVKRSKRLGCQFGGKLYELEEEWHPDLGAPFGLMTCIKCKCITVQKKRRVIGRVACKNFVEQCPVPDCPKPILLPDQCCKTCPGSTELELNVFGSSDYSNDFAKDVGFQEFMAVMTGRFRQPFVATEGVGRAYLTLSRRDLHFSIHFNKLEETPISVQILDKLHSIVFEKTVDKLFDKNVVLVDHSPVAYCRYFLLNQLCFIKICGAWSEIPLVYLKSLKKDELMITIVTSKQPDGALGGKIFKPKIINREVFSSLLFPSTMQGIKNLGYGGAAAIDVQAGGETLNVAVWFDAAVNFSSGYSRHVFISLEKDDGRRRQSQSIRAELMVKDGFYVAEKIINVTPFEQQWLSSGKLLIVLSAEYIVPMEFIGSILPKQSCDVYVAILNNEPAPTTGQAAYAILHMTNNSTIQYTIKTAGVNETNLSAFVMDKENRRHRRRTVLNHGGPFQLEANTIRGTTTDSINLRDMESFYKEKLFFDLTQKSGGHTLRGSIRRLLHSDTVSVTVLAEPILLSGFSVPKHSTETGSAAALWISALEQSKQCSLKYTLIVVGLPIYKADDLKFYLCHKNTNVCFLEIRNLDVNNAEQTKMVVEGESDEVYGPVWAALNSGQVFAKLSTPIHPGGELAGDLTIKNECWKRQVQQDMLVAEDQHTVRPHRLDCDYEGVTYKNGDSFHSLKRNCTLCNCQRGAVKCERVLCPVLNCSSPLVTRAGDCCPTCLSTQISSNKSCYWMGDGRWHETGVSWHPYIAPFGFTKCALCTCQASGEVSCSKTTCPILSCPKRLRYRENPLDCCAKCKTAEENHQPITLKDESNNGRCFFNNRWYREDAKFSPKISHITTLKCIECICRKSRVNCRRTMCSGVPCDDPARRNGCCPRCSGFT